MEVGPSSCDDPVMRELLARWWAHRKLRRGQCINCGTVLRGDDVMRFCGDRCADDWQDRTAY